jgi:hypothetical protein
MNKILSGLMASTLVASFAVASVMPAEAGPVSIPRTEAVQTNAQNVDYYVYRGDNARVYHRNWRAERRAAWRERRMYRRHAWRDRYYSDDPYYHSAYRYHHRRYDNRWRDDSGVRLEFSF